MERNKFIIDQINADIHNIQELVNILPRAKKTQYNNIQSTIKILVKDIRKQKELMTEHIRFKEDKYVLPLFEVEPSEIAQIDIVDITSFFGLMN